MKQKTKILLLISLCILSFSTSVFSQSAESQRILSQLDNGTVNGNVYENRLLGLRIKFPKPMFVDTKEEAETAVKDGVALLRQGKSVDEKLLNEMLRKERIVFTLNLPATDKLNGSALSINIKKDETGEELTPMVQRTIKFFTDSGAFKVQKAAANETIGNLSFVTFILSLETQGVSVLSKNYSVRRNGYLITISVAYVETESLSKMEAVLKGTEVF